MMVGLKRISTVVGLLAVTASAAFGQGTVANPNQMTADSVASALRASRALSGSRIEIEAQDGLVTLTGQLATPALKAEAVARARNVAGVQGVMDRLQVADRTILPAQYQPQVATGSRSRRLRGGNDVLAAVCGSWRYDRRRRLRWRSSGGWIRQRRRSASRRTGRRGRRRRRRDAWQSELCLAQLCSLSQFLRGRLPDGLSLAGLAEYRTLLPLSRGASRLASRDPPVG